MTSWSTGVEPPQTMPTMWYSVFPFTRRCSTRMGMAAVSISGAS